MSFDKRNVLRLCLLLLACLCAPAAAHAVTITRTSSPVFYFNPRGNPTPLRCMYASYQITNTGGYQPNVYASIGGFTGGYVGLAPNEDGVVHIGAMDAGETRTAFFYIQATGVTPPNTTAQHAVTVFNGNPSAGGTAITAANFTMTTMETIQALANKVNTVLSGPNPSTLGGTLTMTVTGKTGTIGAAGILSFTPATYLTWAANSFELYRSTIRFTGGNTGTYTNQLLIQAASPSDTDYEAVYLFRAVNFTNGNIPVSPVAFISSGTQVKHTDTSGYAQLDPVQQITNTTVINKLVNAAVIYNSTVVTYTARLSNSGSTDVQIDQVVDGLPTSPASVTYVPGSSTYSGAAIPDPAVTGSTLTWARTFVVPAGSTRDLTYRVTIPGTLGTYTNRVVGYIASVQIDTTLDVSDNAPARRDVLVTTPPNVTLGKCVVVGADCVTTNSTALPGSDLVFSISFSNTGGYQATNFVITDQVPANTDFKVGSVTSSLGTTGLTVTVSYSNDGGATWAYTPVSAAGGAPAGYDRTVTHVRWSFTGNLSQTAPNNSGSVAFTTRIR